MFFPFEKISLWPNALNGVSFTPYVTASNMLIKKIAVAQSAGEMVVRFDGRVALVTGAGGGIYI
jgi:hypothetical protein